MAVADGNRSSTRAGVAARADGGDSAPAARAASKIIGITGSLRGRGPPDRDGAGAFAADGSAAQISSPAAMTVGQGGCRQRMFGFMRGGRIRDGLRIMT